MPMAGSAAGDFDPRLFEIFSSVARVLSQIQGAVGGMSRGHGPGWRGGPWERGFGRPKGTRQWPPGPGGPGGSGGPGGPGGPGNFGGHWGAWRPSPGAVYPALQQLADEGLIEAEESGGRRTFSLTDDGRRYVEENPEKARAAWESMAQDEPGPVPGLFVQAARLGGSIVQMAHAGTPEQVHAAEQLLERTRSRMYKILAGDVHGEHDEQ